MTNDRINQTAGYRSLEFCQPPKQIACTTFHNDVFTLLHCYVAHIGSLSTDLLRQPVSYLPGSSITYFQERFNFLCITPVFSVFIHCSINTFNQLH